MKINTKIPNQLPQLMIIACAFCMPMSRAIGFDNPFSSKSNTFFELELPEASDCITQVADGLAWGVNKVCIEPASREIARYQRAREAYENLLDAKQVSCEVYGELNKLDVLLDQAKEDLVQSAREVVYPFHRERKSTAAEMLNLEAPLLDVILLAAEREEVECQRKNIDYLVEKAENEYEQAKWTPTYMMASGLHYVGTNSMRMMGKLAILSGRAVGRASYYVGEKLVTAAADTARSAGSSLWGRMCEAGNWLLGTDKSEPTMNRSNRSDALVAYQQCAKHNWSKGPRSSNLIPRARR